jgi:hypothetical protein
MANAVSKPKYIIKRRSDQFMIVLVHLILDIMIATPKNANELRNFLDHVWIYLGQWKRQKTVKNCSRKSAWELLTHEKYSKIHALERQSKLNGKPQTSEFLFFDFSSSSWVVMDYSGLAKFDPRSYSH